MQARYLIIGAVVVIAVVTGVLIYQGNKGGDGASGDVTVTQTVYQSGGSASGPGSDSAGSGGAGSGTAGPEVPGSETSSPAGSTDGTGATSTNTGISTASSPAPTTPATSSGPDDGRPASNIPMRKLKPGEKAPQFVIFSFDGAGSHEKWHLFMDAAKPTDSRFTGFLSGIYLVETANKEAYTGPGHSPGKASIGFGGTKDEIVTEVKDLNLAYSRGHEIGTHYNGHFCVGADPSGDAWSTADWNDELDQFFGFVTNWKKINGYGSDVPDLTVPTSAIKGGRTPCLEGDLDKMVPAWRKHGMTYDTSKNLYSGIAWPKQVQGIWEFPMPYVYSPGFKSMVMAMDYNFWVKFNGGAEQPETAPQLRQIVRQTYDYMFDEAYHGNRAPVLIANHFNNWNGDSFNQPALAFMKDACGKKDVYCATYSDVVAWMELQDPAVLAALQDQAPVATGA
jgi:hypothetical protein